MRLLCFFVLILSSSSAFAQRDPLDKIANALDRMSTSTINGRDINRDIDERSAQQWRQLQQLQNIQQMQVAIQNLHQDNIRLQRELAQEKQANSHSRAWVDAFSKKLDMDDLSTARKQLNDFVQALCKRKRVFDITVN